ncbi:MAG: hypothetical protein LDL13_06100 [Calditerrivibrio sp.]|nr:hypothetical protein [Calditerrivibrio sp.]MCA1980402.1 hypothetical protein [Calditerrivibrio sp.]
MAYHEDEKKKIAQAIKERWIEIGKWEGKNISKKQAEKIKKIKEIIG